VLRFAIFNGCVFGRVVRAAQAIWGATQPVQQCRQIQNENGVVAPLPSTLCACTVGGGVAVGCGGRQIVVPTIDATAAEDPILRRGGWRFAVTCIAKLNDGQRAVSGLAIGDLYIWTVSTLENDLRLHGHTRAVTGVCVLGQRIVSASDDATLRVWNSTTGACKRVLHGHEVSVAAVCALTDGARVASGSADASVRVWHIATGTCERVLRGHRAPVRAVCALHDGRVASGSLDQSIRMWRV
jgi:hypothetical protein